MKHAVIQFYFDDDVTTKWVIKARAKLHKMLLHYLRIKHQNLKLEKNMCNAVCFVRLKDEVDASGGEARTK